MKLKIRDLVSSNGVAYIKDCLRQVNIHNARITPDGLVFPHKKPSELQLCQLRRLLGSSTIEMAVWDGPQAA